MEEGFTRRTCHRFKREEALDWLHVWASDWVELWAFFFEYETVWGWRLFWFLGGRGVEVNLTCPGFHTELIQIENKSENVYRTIPGRCWFLPLFTHTQTFIRHTPCLQSVNYIEIMFTVLRYPCFLPYNSFPNEITFAPFTSVFTSCLSFCLPLSAQLFISLCVLPGGEV